LDIGLIRVAAENAVHDNFFPGKFVSLISAVIGAIWSSQIARGRPGVAFDPPDNQLVRNPDDIRLPDHDPGLKNMS